MSVTANSRDAPERGLVQPHNLEAEESVLGAMLLSAKAAETAAELLGPSDFYRPSHGTIFAASRELLQKGEPVDAITLVDLLEQRGELERSGGRERIHELVALVPAASNVGYHAQIVKEMATLRGIISAGEDIARLGWERPDLMCTPGVSGPDAHFTSPHRHQQQIGRASCRERVYSSV